MLKELIVLFGQKTRGTVTNHEKFNEHRQKNIIDFPLACERSKVFNKKKVKNI